MQIYNPYFIDGEPQLYNSYCAFLDILGFSKKIEEDTSGNNLRKFYWDFRRISQITSNHANYDKWFYYKSFTDNILLAKPEIDHRDDIYFGYTMMDIREYQFNMVMSGYFIRGGFSLGPLFIDEHQIYGVPLIEAYRLESQDAVYPIVILSDTVKSRVDLYIQYCAPSYCPTRASILILDDGTYFINYLSEIFDYDDNFQRESYLRIHRDYILKNINNYAVGSSIYQKYLFSAQYHNYCLEVLKYKDLCEENLFICIPEGSVNHTFGNLYS